MNLGTVWLFVPALLVSFVQPTTAQRSVRRDDRPSTTGQDG
jgi:hypothetical protein